MRIFTLTAKSLGYCTDNKNLKQNLSRQQAGNKLKLHAYTETKSFLDPTLRLAETLL